MIVETTLFVDDKDDSNADISANKSDAYGGGVTIKIYKFVCDVVGNEANSVHSKTRIILAKGKARELLAALQKALEEDTDEIT